MNKLQAYHLCSCLSNRKFERLVGLHFRRKSNDRSGISQMEANLFELYTFFYQIDSISSIGQTQWGMGMHGTGYLRHNCHRKLWGLSVRHLTCNPRTWAHSPPMFWLVLTILTNLTKLHENEENWVKRVRLHSFSRESLQKTLPPVGLDLMITGSRGFTGLRV